MQKKKREVKKMGISSFKEVTKKKPTKKQNPRFEPGADVYLFLIFSFETCLSFRIKQAAHIANPVRSGERDG